MKKILLILFICTPFLFSACASDNVEDSFDYYSESVNENSSVDDENATSFILSTSDDFVADFNPIKMEEMIFLLKSKNTVKPKQVTYTHFIPRRNTVEYMFRSTTNAYVISFNKKEREKIIKTCQLFLEQYEAKTLPHHKISSKTAFMTSSTQIWYGVVSPATEVPKAKYLMDCEFIDKKPYLILKFIPSISVDGRNYSPKLSLYLSPTQVRNFIEQISQENLTSLVTELAEKAYTY